MQSLRSILLLVIFSSFYLKVKSQQVKFFLPESATISTIAGDGSAGSVNKGLEILNSIFIDTSENVYIVDSGNHRIRKIWVNTGTISTIAGIGKMGYNGDGNLATAARLNNPKGIFVDTSENVYIVDSGNHRIRKIWVNTGTISTIAGTGITDSGGDGRSATAAELNNPTGVSVNTWGSVYIADSGNHRIRKIWANGSITTVAGTNTFGYNGDGGFATAAELNNPTGISIDTSGNINIAESDNHRIRKVTRVSQDKKELSLRAQRFELSVAVLSGTWTLESSNPWLSISENFGELGETLVYVQVSTATGVLTRTGTLSLKIGTTTKTFEVTQEGRNSQTITFNELASTTYGDTSFISLTGTSTSGLALTYVSSHPNVATITGTQVFINGAGTTMITASQTGNTNYLPATSTFLEYWRVNRKVQTITFNELASTTYGDTSFYLTGTSHFRFAYSLIQVVRSKCSNYHRNTSVYQ